MAKKNLMIVESPAKAKTIEKYLGSDFVVKASYGHVRDLPKADDAIDIEHGFEPKYIVLPDKKDVIKELKQLAKEAETVWLATDEDREGEAISWHLAEVLGLDTKLAKRVVFNEITKKAVVDAVANPRLINLDLVNAQQARRVLDRLVGFKLSPILWSKVRTGLSAGRVQSVAVRLIVEREREIQAFNSESTFKVVAEFGLAAGQRLLAETRGKYVAEEKVRKFLESCVGATFTITGLETKPGKRSPAAPFTTSTLQQEASRKLGFGVSQTMRVAQSLYEAGHITYMRTDSVNLSGFAIAAAEEVIKRKYGPEYHKARQYKSKNSSAQEAHEAIRPSKMTASEISGERNEQRLYDLIWKRTVASQMADAVTERTTVTVGISTNPEELVATGEVIKFDGFLKVYMESQDDEEEEEGGSGVLPPINKGQVLNLTEIVARERFTKHLPRYAEASLVKKLEELGIGRPSTFAPTISTIQKREYVTKENREGFERTFRVIKLQGAEIKSTEGKEVFGAEKAKLFPSDLGMLVTDFLTENFPKVLDYSFTAKVEEEFDEIALGTKTWNNMISSFYGDFSETVKDTKDNAARVGKERVLGVHPKSGMALIAKFGRYGPFVQMGETVEGGAKPTYASLRKDQLLDTITLDEAVELFKLPRDLGELEGLKVKANIGRFGPYIQLGKEFFSIPKGEDPYEITLERAAQVIDDKRNAEKNKLIKEIAPEIQVLNGRFGPYIKMKGANLKIPKGIEPASITLEDCEKYFEVQKDKPKGRAPRGAKKGK
ncbi:MAG: type I DNA topoisomerase [Bacteroidetes bacterium]|nr:type I DNA topoisomerase [Bacteroidota bacterium]